MTNTKILIEDYNATWPQTFQRLKAIYELHLSDSVIDIQHVGSTSVPGLSAKPIIDVDLIIANRNNLKPLIEKLALLGYDHQGNMGITGREAFKCRSDKTPYDGSSRAWQKHNLYVCPLDSISLKNHLAFRNYLCDHPEKAKEYGELKKRLAFENPYDINLYVENKTPFIISILKEMEFDDITLNSIAEENKLSKGKVDKY